jgi:hypothetical protein
VFTGIFDLPVSWIIKTCFTVVPAMRSVTVILSLQKEKYEAMPPVVTMTLAGSPIRTLVGHSVLSFIVRDARRHIKSESTGTLRTTTSIIHDTHIL